MTDVARPSAQPGRAAERALAPDLARGLMLLMIVLAHAVVLYGRTAGLSTSTPRGLGADRSPAVDHDLHRLTGLPDVRVPVRLRHGLLYLRQVAYGRRPRRPGAAAAVTGGSSGLRCSRRGSVWRLVGSAQRVAVGVWLLTLVLAYAQAGSVVRPRCCSPRSRTATDGASGWCRRRWPARRRAGAGRPARPAARGGTARCRLPAWSTSTASSRSAGPAAQQDDAGQRVSATVAYTAAGVQMGQQHGVQPVARHVRVAGVRAAAGDHGAEDHAPPTGPGVTRGRARTTAARPAGTGSRRVRRTSQTASEISTIESSRCSRDQVGVEVGEHGDAADDRLRRDAQRQAAGEPEQVAAAAAPVGRVGSR